MAAGTRAAGNAEVPDSGVVASEQAPGPSATTGTAAVHSSSLSRHSCQRAPWSRCAAGDTSRAAASSDGLLGSLRGHAAAAMVRSPRGRDVSGGWPADTPGFRRLQPAITDVARVRSAVAHGIQLPAGGRHTHERSAVAPDVRHLRPAAHHPFLWLPAGPCDSHRRAADTSVLRGLPSGRRTSKRPADSQRQPARAHSRTHAWGLHRPGQRTDRSTAPSSSSLQLRRLRWHTAQLQH